MKLNTRFLNPRAALRAPHLKIPIRFMGPLLPSSRRPLLKLRYFFIGWSLGMLFIQFGFEPNRYTQTLGFLGCCLLSILFALTERALERERRSHPYRATRNN